MDIEGAEYRTLYSTPRKIFDKIDKIFLEVHDVERYEKDELLRFLKNSGFILRFKNKDFLYAIKN